MDQGAGPSSGAAPSSPIANGLPNGKSAAKAAPEKTPKQGQQAEEGAAGEGRVQGTGKRGNLTETEGRATGDTTFHKRVTYLWNHAGKLVNVHCVLGTFDSRCFLHKLSLLQLCCKVFRCLEIGQAESVCMRYGDWGSQHRGSWLLCTPHVMDTTSPLPVPRCFGTGARLRMTRACTPGVILTMLAASNTTSHR